MILDSDGNPVTSEQPDTRCPRCLSEKRERVSGFGGHRKLLCSNCGFDFGTGAEESVEEGL